MSVYPRENDLSSDKIMESLTYLTGNFNLFFNLIFNPFLLCPKLVSDKRGLNQIALNDNDNFILL